MYQGWMAYITDRCALGGGRVATPSEGAYAVASYQRKKALRMLRDWRTRNASVTLPLSTLRPLAGSIVTPWQPTTTTQASH